MHGGHYDSDEDRSRIPTLDPRGPWAFSANLLVAVPPARYYALIMVAKYYGETNPSVWL
jgi:hypothetical protein